MVLAIAEGKATVTVTAEDSDGNRVSDSFVVTVTTAQANSVPTVANAISDATIVNGSGSHQESLANVFSDADGDSLTITAASSDPDVATVSVATDGSSLTVSAQGPWDRHHHGHCERWQRRHGGRRPSTVTVKAAPTVSSAIADVTGLEAGSTRDVSLSGVFSDADGDPLTITAQSSDTAKATVTVASDGSKLTLTGVAAGTAAITVTAEDADGNRAGDQFQVSVVQAQQQQTPPEGPEPWNIQVVPGDGTLTVTWNVSSRDGFDDSEIRHALRWSQESGVWANPRCTAGFGPNDGWCVDGGVTSYTITGLRNGVATGVFIRSFTGDSYSERSPHSSKWVRIKGANTTPRAAQ